MSIYLGDDNGYNFLRNAVKKWPKNGNAGPHTGIPTPAKPRENRGNDAQHDSSRARDRGQRRDHRRDKRHDNRQRLFSENDGA